MLMNHFNRSPNDFQALNSIFDIMKQLNQSQKKIFQIRQNLSVKRPLLLPLLLFSLFKCVILCVILKKDPKIAKQKTVPQNR